MSHSRMFSLLTGVLLLAMLGAPGVAAADAAPATVITSKSGAGFIYADQAVWHNRDCPAPTRMSPKDGDSYTCPAPVKLPYPPPQRRPIPIRLP